MPLIPSGTKSALSKNISEFHTGNTYAHTLAKFGKERADKQAVAAAYSNARKHGAKFALGGSPDYFAHRAFSQIRSEGLHPPGLVKSAVPGRTDKINASVPSGSYILPADFVSHLGQGNTMAGAKHLGSMFHSTIPKPGRLHFARGGAADEGKPVQIIIAGGEYVLHPDQVRHADEIANKLPPGTGDLKRGHNALDAWVVHERKKHIKTLGKLPGPRKD